MRPNWRTKGFFFQVSAALCVALLVVFLQIARDKPAVPRKIRPSTNTDTLGYLAVAATLHDGGRFTDGTYQNQAVVTGNHGEGMFFAPLYPAFLAMLMVFDEGFYKSTLCLVQHSNDIVAPCYVDWALPIFIQGILAGFSALLVWLSALYLTGRKSVAWIAMALVLITHVYAEMAQKLGTESLYYPLFTLTSLLGTAGLQNKHSGTLFASGVALGILTLVRPSFSYLLYFIAGAAVLYAIWVLVTKKRDLSFPKLALFLVIGYALAISPWIIRNGTKLGSYTISQGYAPFILSQRVAYNDMTTKEWLVSFTLPGGTTSLARKLFSPADFERLDPGFPTGFVQMGYDPLRRKRILAAAGGADRQLSYLVKTYILQHPVRHTLVTVALVWQGMWICKLWGMVTIPVFVAVLVYAVKTRWWSFILYAIPPWYMLGFNAFVSGNTLRYNYVLLPCLAIASAWGVLWLCDRIKGTRPIVSGEPVVKSRA